MSVLTEVPSHKFHFGTGQKGGFLGAGNSPMPLLALQQTQKLEFQIKFPSKSTDSRNTLMVFWAKASGSTAVFSVM